MQSRATLANIAQFLPRHALTWLACETAHARGNRPLLLLFPDGDWAGRGWKFDWESSIH